MFPSSVSSSSQLWPAVFFLLLVLVDSQSDYGGDDSSYHDLFKHYPHLRHFVGHPKYTGVYHQSRSHSNSPHIPMDHKYYDGGGGGDESYEDYHSRGNDYKSKEPYGYRHKSREDDQYNNNDQYSNDHYTENALPDHYAKHYENWAENEPYRRDRSHYQKKYSHRQPAEYPSYTSPKHSEYSGYSGYSGYPEHPSTKHTRPSSYDDTYKMKHNYRSPYHSYNVPIEAHHPNSPAKHNQDTDEISEYTGGFSGLPDFGKFEYNQPSGFSYDTEIHHITDPIGKSSNKLASVLSLK
ncbi:uncharacterized protein LOC141849747 [Brevipalpus obovatus]|uniref:uncharacterized protein LOC141849747 n=1 Tax=Brevipalpus obovatus TaxID=246614 RepID=UPI003D9DF8C6